MNDCIFCSIVEKNIPYHEIIWADNYHIAFLSIHPSKEGHTLVIPKRHIDDIASLTKSEYADLFESARLVSLVLKERLNCHIVAIVTEGNSVKHAHVHLIPLQKGEPLAVFSTADKSAEELSQIAAKIRAAK